MTNIDLDAEEFDGSCHCGGVRFHVRLADGLRTARRCDCSFCRMGGAVAVTAREGDLAILSGGDLLTLYQFNTATAKHYFCSRCGIYTHHRRRSNPNELGVNAAVSKGSVRSISKRCRSMTACITHWTAKDAAAISLAFYASSARAAANTSLPRIRFGQARANRRRSERR